LRESKETVFSVLSAETWHTTHERFTEFQKRRSPFAALHSEALRYL
jgi:hypothetical protein